MEIEKDKFVEIERKGNIGTFVYIPSNYTGQIAIDNQPERSKREDSYADILKDIEPITVPQNLIYEAMGCGTLNTMET